MAELAQRDDGGFAAPWWLRGPHLQTLYAPLLRRVEPPPRRRERLELADGDFVDLDWAGPAGDPRTPLVVLLHGLAGSSASPYLAGLQRVLAARGWGSVALNFRGASGEPNRRAHSYHSGETGDLAALLAVLRQRHPERRLAAVGFSLGGNVLLKWLGESGSGAGLDVACAVSVPLRLDLCASRLDRGLSRAYRDHLLRQLKRALAAKQAHLQRRGDRAELERFARLGDWRAARSFWQFDQAVIAPLHGFASAADYYARASSWHYLDGIRVPTLLVQARDDPFMGHGTLPPAVAWPPTVTLRASPGGGHVGFVHGSPLAPRFWLEQCVPEFLASQL